MWLKSDINKTVETGEAESVIKYSWQIMKYWVEEETADTDGPLFLKNVLFIIA